MKNRAALLMIVPAVGFYLLTFVGPIILVGRLSLFKTDYVTSVFVWFKNYAEAFQDKYFIKSFGNVFWMVLGIAPVTILVSYWITMFLIGLNNKLQAAGRFICYVPSLTSGLVMTMLWSWLLMRTGLINQFLAEIGIPAIPWLGAIWPARISIVMVSLSSGAAGFVILFSAAAHSIPTDLKDAAIIDGASERQYRTKIVRPLMMPTILLTLLLMIVGVMQIMELIYVLTYEGGPYGSTSTPAYNIFQTAFIFGQSGYAAAKGLILMVVIAAIVLVKQRLEKWAGRG